jgi:polyhydroxyalkanoate synthesis regulator protein
MHCVTLPRWLYNSIEVTAMPLIKRYANRKLYDTESKRYITLDGIAEMIRQQQDAKDQIVIGS